MNTKHFFALIAALLLSSGSAHSALVTSLTFKDPTGTVSPTESIDIWVTLALADESDPLVIDSSLDYPFGMPASAFPSHGSNGEVVSVPFASYTGLVKATSSYCNDTFTGGCGRGENYAFWFNTSYDAYSSSKPINLAPGESMDFLFGTFVPLGAASLGEYTFYNVTFWLTFQGLDAEGNNLGTSIELGATCPDSSSSCAFTRTVVSDVPIPAAALLFLSGLSLLGGAAMGRGRNNR